MITAVQNMILFQIDEMQGEKLVASHTVSGATALDALAKITVKALVIRSSQAHWLRVVDERQGQVFHYAHLDQGFV